MNTREQAQLAQQAVNEIIDIAQACVDMEMTIGAVEEALRNISGYLDYARAEQVEELLAELEALA